MRSRGVVDGWGWVGARSCGGLRLRIVRRRKKGETSRSIYDGESQQDCVEGG